MPARHAKELRETYEGSFEGVWANCSLLHLTKEEVLSKLQPLMTPASSRMWETKQAKPELS